MREDCGILVVARNCRLLAVNPLAEYLVGHPLPLGMDLSGDSPLRTSFSRAGHPLEKILDNEQDNHGWLEGKQLAEHGLWFTSFPLQDEANQVTGTVITLVRTEETLDHALKFLGLSHEELMERLPEGAFMVNTRWQICYFNEAAQRITGFSKREAVGKFCWEIFRSEMCHNSCPMRKSMSTGEVLLDREVEIISKTGEKKLIVVNTSQVKKSGNKVFGGLETFHECGYMQASTAKMTGQPLFADIVGVSSKMQEIITRLPMIAASESNVLIQGESGTGKELIARAVHLHSSRRKGPLVAVNCSAIPETLLESELFGHERGAFTGAIAAKPGRFELAKGGTLFLDEIGDLKPQVQVKLLRVLEDRAFERVGGTRKIPLEARIIAATNVELKEAMRQGRFREDLYYRLFTVPIYMPPLRERREDIPILVKHFVEQLNCKLNKKVRGVEPKVMKSFCHHHWPGNVRELQHILEYCFVFVKGPVIFERYLPSMETSWTDRGLELDIEGAPLQALEKKAIITALEAASGNKQEAARLLQISRTKLWRKIKAHKITPADFKSERAQQL